MYKEIRDKLYTKLDGLTSTTDLGYVYDYEPKSLKEWFVSAVIAPSEQSEDYYDSDKNLGTYTFAINIFLVNDDPKSYEWPFLELIDEIQLALRQDETLQWTALWVIMKTSFGYTWDETGMKFVKIEVTYSALLGINT